MKVLHIKLKKCGKDEQKPIENKGIDYPADPTKEPIDKAIQKCIDDNWKYMINRHKPQYDKFSKEEGCMMYGKSDKVITFTDGNYKLCSGTENEAFDAILDHPDNIAAQWYLKFYDPTKKTTVPVVLQVYADYSVQLWSDPETTLIAWGWIKAENRTNVAIYLNFEEYETEYPIKLVTNKELNKCVNQVDNKEFYVFPCTAPFGVIPSHSFSQPMKADGLFFARCRNRGKVTTIKGTVIHPSIHKAGEFSTIKHNSTGDIYMRFAKQAYQFDADNKSVEVCWKNWNLLTQQQKDQLKDKSKKNAANKCKEQGYDPEHPFQNFLKVIQQKVRGNKNVRGNKEKIQKLFLSMKDDIHQLLDKKLIELEGSDDEFCKIDDSSDRKLVSDSEEEPKNKSGKNIVIALNKLEKMNKKFDISTDDEKNSESWKRFKNPRPWMDKDWDDQKHQKWLNLIEVYPKVMPFRIGNSIKNHPKMSVEELIVKIEKNIAEKKEWRNENSKSQDKKSVAQKEVTVEDSENWTFVYPKKWMNKDWDNSKHEKWSNLIEVYPKVMPYRIGNVIKNHPKLSLTELKAIIDKNISEKPEWNKEKPKHQEMLCVKLTNLHQEKKFIEEKIEEKANVDEWKNYECARPWMSKDWNKEKHAKWLKLCEWMPIRKPLKFGKVIKENFTKDLKELKEIINKRITEKIQPLKKTFDKDELHYFEILKEVMPNARYFCAKAVIKNKEAKLELDELMAKTLGKFEHKKEKYNLKKNTPAPKK